MCVCRYDFKSHSVFFGPFLSSRFEFDSVDFVQLSDLRHKRVIRIGIGKQRRNRKKNLWDGESGWPLILQDVETDRAVGVDVRMVDFGNEIALRRSEGVVGREMDVEEENAASIGTVFGTHDCGLPVELVILDWSGWAVSRRVFLEVSEFFCDSFVSHLYLILWRV